MFPTRGKNRKRRADAFEWHEDANADADNQAPPTVRRKHTDINVNMAGLSSTQSSYVTAPASPVKPHPSERIYRDDYLLHQMGLEIEIEDGLAGVSGAIEDENQRDNLEGDELEEDVDPQYQRHLEDNDADVGIVKARGKRTPAVSTLYQTRLLLILIPQPPT